MVKPIQSITKDSYKIRDRKDRIFGDRRTSDLFGFFNSSVIELRLFQPSYAQRPE